MLNGVTGIGLARPSALTAELVLAALNMALQQRRPHGVIDHSDQGGANFGLQELMTTRPTGAIWLDEFSRLGFGAGRKEAGGWKP